MSIDVLISGRLRGAPTLRTASNGSPYARFILAAADKNGESLLCGCITFAENVIQTVKALDDGDSISATGEAALSHWNDSAGTARHGLDVIVYGVLTAYHVGRKRRATEASQIDPDGAP